MRLPPLLSLKNTSSPLPEPLDRIFSPAWYLPGVTVDQYARSCTLALNSTRSCRVRMSWTVPLPL